jgi:hypothetical protein
MIQSSLSPIELADTWQRRLFVTSVIFGVAAALVGALLALLLWKANNRYQEAVTADANARIEEAKRGAEEARKDAAEANKKAKELELRIEEESRKRAQAEERLERVRKKISPRGITALEPLEKGPKSRVEILYQRELPEAYNFARDLRLCFVACGWEAGEPRPIPIDETRPHVPAATAAGARNTDVTIRARVLEDWLEKPDSVLATLHAFFRANGLGVSANSNRDLPRDLFQIVIGPKW